MLAELVIATWFEGLYQQTLRAAAGRGLPAISRTAFWLLVMREVGPTPSAQVVKALLNLGPEVEQMLALTRLRLKR
jgi:hypothetical protein